MHVRVVMLVDKESIVRYIQIEPGVTNLPDMEKTFNLTQELVQE